MSDGYTRSKNEQLRVICTILTSKPCITRFRGSLETLYVVFIKPSPPSAIDQIIINKLASRHFYMTTGGGFDASGNLTICPKIRVRPRTKRF